MKIKFDHFSLLAPFYESFIHPKDPQKLRSLVPDAPQGIMLDAGGGTGRVSQFLRGKAARIVVADGSFQMLREARKKEGMRTIQTWTERFPFQKDCFDCIIMVDALHHVANQAETASELWRVLKPGGRLIIEEPDIHKFGVKLIALAEKLALMRSHFLSTEQIIKLFQGKGSTTYVELEDSLVWVIIEK